jgi:hypothetical protein
LTRPSSGISIHRKTIVHCKRFFGLARSVRGVKYFRSMKGEL